MVRVKILVRIIPEDVYLQSVESATQYSVTAPLAREKRLLEVVNDPENVPIGLLANKIGNTFKSIQGGPLGGIKYLKDGELDADLDPDMSVYDAFVDAGQAAAAPIDQRATIKIVRKISGKNFDVREGSVVPDLRKSHFQLPRRPTVPRFWDTTPGTGKRSLEQAFHGPTSNRDDDPSTNLVTRFQSNLSRQETADGGLSRSIEQDTDATSGQTRRRDADPPSAFSGIQDSLLQPEPKSEHEGSIILGDDRPSSGSPEIGESVHSLPIGDEAATDLQILETAPPPQLSTTLQPRKSDHFEEHLGAGDMHKAVSETSSTYYSPLSDPSKSASRDNTSDKGPVSRSVETSSMPNGDVVEKRAGERQSTSASETSIKEPPIIPPSSSPRQGQSKATETSPSHSHPYVAVPSSEASTMSSRARRHERAESVELDIHDTQMSPRSRTPSTRKRDRGTNGKTNGKAARSVTSKEVWGLLKGHHTKQPVIQDGKRQRKETTWDFSQHIEGLSETDNENRMPSGRFWQHEIISDDSVSEYEGPAKPVEQSSESHPIPKLGNGKLKTSTEWVTKPTTVGSITPTENATTEAQQSGTTSGHSAAENPDTSDNNRGQKRASRTPPEPNPDSTGQLQTACPSRVNQADHHEARLEVGFGRCDPVLETSNNDDLAERDVPAEPDLSRHLGKVTGPSKLSTIWSSLFNTAAPKPRQRNENTSPAEADRCRTVDEAQPWTRGTQVRDEARHEDLMRNLPDEQLTNDLQASARADSDIIQSQPKRVRGRPPIRRQPATKAKAAAKVKGDSSRLSVKSQKEVDLTRENPHNTGQDRNDVGPGADNQEPTHLDTNKKKVGSKTPSVVSHEEKHRDGKMGLGFSQSLPGTRRVSVQPSFWSPEVSSDEDEVGKDSTALPPSRGKHRTNFLKRSKPIQRLMSSQSSHADSPCPSQLVQPTEWPKSKNQHVAVEISSSKPDDSTARSPNRSGSAHPESSKHGFQSKADSVEDSSTSRVEEIAGKRRVSVEVGRKTAIGSNNSSDPASSASHQQPALPVSVGQRGKSIHSTSIGTDADKLGAESGSQSSGSASHSRTISPSTAERNGKPPLNKATDAPKGRTARNVDRSRLIMPPGFTQDEYLAARANFQNHPPELSQRKRNKFARTSATPIANPSGAGSTSISTTSSIAAKTPFHSKGTEAHTKNTGAAKDAKVTEASSSIKPFFSSGANGKAGNGVLNTSKKADSAAASAGGSKQAPRSSPIRQNIKAVTQPAKTAIAPAGVRGPTKAPPSSSARNTTRERVYIPRPATLNELRISHEATRAARAAQKATEAAPPSSAVPLATRAGPGNYHLTPSETESESTSSSDDEDGDLKDPKAFAQAVARFNEKLGLKNRPEVDLTIRDPIRGYD